jgi:serine/threonine-protein kinase
MATHGYSAVRDAAPLVRRTTADAVGSEAPSAVHLIVHTDGDLLHAGQLLGGTYEVRAKIGQGGMGEVYEAYDRALHRRVAIKVARPGLEATIANEARALATIRHPATVAVYALGVDDGVHYVVMERLHGETLEAHVERRRARLDPLGVDEIVHVLTAIAEGLAVVHRAGMAHRDVKPANVMLAPDDRVVLTDFGIFQPEIEVRKGASCAGSPLYMAPEAITTQVTRGELYLVDIYALGIVAYELLTGAVPYDEPDVLRVLWMHVYAPPPDLSACVGTPAPLVSLVQQMLAKDPEARPQSAEEVAWRLRHAR